MDCGITCEATAGSIGSPCTPEATRALECLLMRLSRALNYTGQETGGNESDTCYEGKIRMTTYNKKVDTLSSILSYINLQLGSSFVPWTATEHLPLDLTFLRKSSSESGSSSFSPFSSKDDWLMLNFTANFSFRCPKGVIISDGLPEE